MSYKVEKGIPIPAAKRIYPFNEMDVGDSFFVTNEEILRVASASTGYSRRNNTRFRRRKYGNGWRIWRVR